MGVANGAASGFELPDIVANRDKVGGASSKAPANSSGSAPM